MSAMNFICQSAERELIIQHRIVGLFRLSTAFCELPGGADSSLSRAFWWIAYVYESDPRGEILQLCVTTEVPTGWPGL